MARFGRALVSIAWWATAVALLVALVYLIASLLGWPISSIPIEEQASKHLVWLAGTAFLIFLCFLVVKKEKQWFASGAVVCGALVLWMLFGESLARRTTAPPAIAMAAPNCRGMERPRDLDSQPVGLPSGCFMHFVILEGAVVFQSRTGSRERRGTGSTVPLHDNFGAILAWGDPSAKVIFYFCPLGAPRWGSSGCTS